MSASGRARRLRGTPVAVVVDARGEQAALLSPSGPLGCGPIPGVAATMARMEDDPTNPPRWVWWRATDVRALVEQGLHVRRCWDLAQVHHLLVGGLDGDRDAVWAAAHRLSVARRPPLRTGDLFDAQPAAGTAVREDGYLDPTVLEPDWLRGEQHLLQWARLALQVAARQPALLARRPRALQTAASESGAALLCVELERAGLPVDRERMSALIEDFAGPRPATDADAAVTRAQRDARVLQHTRGGDRIDLRNPAQVLRMLHEAGVRVDDTRAHHLEPYRHTHPLVDALLTWRRAERIATTYGWSWLSTHVGTDGRLRGTWTACDGGAGRMTAGAGLHSLPTPLRAAVAATEGRRLVRADLGQVEPRVLAVVSGDPALASATASDDLYAQVARELGLDRPTAKVAVLAAMYGQTSGAAAEALHRMDRSYPAAMRFLRAAADRGERGLPVLTFGGRRVPVRQATEPAARRATGRFTRNAVVQGSAAELFKAWALTAREALRTCDGRIVLCLHDELLVDVPQDCAEHAARALHETLTAAARRWSGGAPVRFVADVSVVQRWSEAKE